MFVYLFKISIGHNESAPSDGARSSHFKLKSLWVSVSSSNVNLHIPARRDTATLEARSSAVTELFDYACNLLGLIIIKPDCRPKVVTPGVSSDQAPLCPACWASFHQRKDLTPDRLTAGLDAIGHCPGADPFVLTDQRRHGGGQAAYLRCVGLEDDAGHGAMVAQLTRQHSRRSGLASVGLLATLNRHPGCDLQKFAADVLHADAAFRSGRIM